MQSQKQQASRLLGEISALQSKYEIRNSEMSSLQRKYEAKSKELEEAKEELQTDRLRNRYKLGLTFTHCNTIFTVTGIVSFRYYIQYVCNLLKLLH